jgi:transcriptional regulator with XRE-family HTH domain
MQAISVILFEEGYAADMQKGRPSKRPRPPFGERLRALREAAGLSQQQVADKLDMTQTAYAWWERNPVALRPEQLQSLAAALNVTVEELMGTAASKKRGAGPVGKARQIFERVSQLPRATQQRILANVEDALTAYEVRKGG